MPTKPTKKAAKGPSYQDMIVAAIAALKDRTGSSRQAGLSGTDSSGGFLPGTAWGRVREKGQSCSSTQPGQRQVKWQIQAGKPGRVR